MSTPDATDDTGASRDVFLEVERAIGVLQGHHDPVVRDAVNTLLGGVDAVHRAGLTHLVQALRSMAGDTLINRLIADPAVRMLLMSYDLVAVDRRIQAEEALDTVRGHLHDHGIDIEILEVVGGVVYAKLHVAPAVEVMPLDRVRSDVEAALRALFIGFQELVFEDRARHTPAPVTTVSLASLKRAGRPVYTDAAALDELPDGGLYGVLVNDVPVLLGRVGGEIYALRNECGDSPLPLAHGTLEGAEVRCPWHGCRYDLRTGRRLDAPGSVQVLPVKVEDGRVLIASGVAHGNAAG